MTVLSELSKIAYIGDSSQTLYPIPFEYINVDNIHVSVYTKENEFVEDWTYSNQYIIENSNVKVLSGFEIDNTKKLLIIRVIDAVQDNRYREGGDFPAKSTETSFDKLTMLIQQHQEVLDRCVKVEVLDNQTPEELLAEVYSKLDSATDVANDAIAAAEQATVAAEQATTAVEEAKKQVIASQEYVDAAKLDINNTVNAGKEEINKSIDEAQMDLSDTINQAVEDVKAEAVSAAEGAIQDAANTAIQIATEHANTVIIPPLQGYVDNARESATSAEESFLSASASALSASQSASNALASETNAKNSASEAALHNLKNKITNCITEIPQDIKLELVDGVFTLKAGSKVYVPNGKNADGSNKFDEVVIESDLSLKQQYDDNDMFMFVYTHPNGIKTLGSVYKGVTYETRPTAVGDYRLHYITSENKMFWDAPGYATTENSFPIAIVDRSADVGFTSIDQVFNGFGYIGSTVFALPGVKGLIPNGRNADGSLNNVEFTLDKVLTYTYSVTLNNAYMNIVADSGKPTGLNYRVISGTQTSGWYHDEEKNIYTYNGSVKLWVDYGTISTTNGVITSLQPKLPFRAVDYNELNNEVKKLELNMPTGVILPFTGQTAPKGFLICDGSAISRKTYASLFAIISTTYGSGDGSTTFNIPNYTNARFVTSGNISVMGDGKALGITDGINWGVLYNGGGDSYHRVAMHPTNNGIGSNVGQTGLNMFSQFGGIAWGVVADASLSGIKGTASLASTCRFIIKY